MQDSQEHTDVLYFYDGTLMNADVCRVMVMIVSVHQDHV